MSDKSALERTIAKVTNPWDLLFGAAGAAVGAGVTVASHGMDLGASVVCGFSAGITVRQAGVASLQPYQLQRRATALGRLLSERLPNHGDAETCTAEAKTCALIDRLERETELFRKRVITSKQFSKVLDGLVDEYRSVTDGRRP